MTQQPGPQDPLVISYLSMRKVVGVIACALPLALAFGKILLQGPGIEGSISYYYYTDMRSPSGWPCFPPGRTWAQPTRKP